MQVIYFIMKRPIENPIDVDVVCKEFGDNIPKYTLLEDSDCSGSVYLCCVDATVDIKSICDKHKYVCGRLVHKFTIDSEKYDDTYMVNTCWACTKDESPYMLCKK